MRNIFQSIGAYLARFYNWIPQSFKVTVYNATSVFISATSILVIADIQAIIDESDNGYKLAGLVFLIAIFSGLVNEIQKKLTDLGNVKLLSQGNTKAVTNLEAKIVETKELKKLV